MSSSRQGARRQAPSRIWRGLDSDRVPAAAFAVELPNEVRGSQTSVPERIEAARAEAYRQGHAAAVAEIAASAEGERRARLNQLAEAITVAARSVAEQRHASVSVAEVEVVELAMELAEAVVQRELAVSRSAATDALERALGLVPSGEDLVVRLNPDDVIDPADLQVLVPDRRVLVVADAGVEIGGCVVDAGPCHVDAQIGPALARARAMIERLHPVRRPEEPGVGEPVAGEPNVGEPVTGEPVAGGPVVGEPVVGEPAVGEPVGSEMPSAVPALLGVVPRLSPPGPGASGPGVPAAGELADRGSPVGPAELAVEMRR